MSEWKEYKLGTVAKVISGFAFKSKDFTKDKGIPAIKIKNIKNGNVDLDDTDFVNESFLSINSRYHLNRNDILVSLTGSHMTQPNSVVGRIALYRHDFTSLLNQRAGKVLPNENQIDKQFLYCFLSQDSIKEKIAMKANGAASQANVSPGDVEDLDIRLPPLPTQQKIAHILGTYDELIEVNNERIKLLEETAQSLYKEWFVRFRFPNYQETEFIKGVPKGWEVVRFRDFIKLNRGFDLPNEKIIEGEYPVIASTNIKAFHNEYKSSGEGVITGRSGSLGAVQYINGNYWTLNTALYVKDFKGNLPKYVYYFLKEMHLENFDSGAGVPTLNQNHLHGLKFPLPPIKLQKQFDEIISPMFTQIETLQQQNTELRQIRDRLLPRLISGKMEV